MSAVAEARPRGVAVAVALLCITAIVGTGSGAYHIGHSQAVRALSQQLPHMQAIQYGELIFSLALNLFFAAMVFLRHNWARIVVLVFFILGVLLSLPSYLGAFHVSQQAKIFGSIGFLVQLVALVLLFTGQRNLWFKRDGA
jgi:hypothetical protein